MKKRRTKFNNPSMEDLIEGQKHTTPEQQEIELYNNFMVNKILNLNNIYLLSVINKQMEMEQISQERQLVMMKSQIATMKRESAKQVE